MVSSCPHIILLIRGSGDKTINFSPKKPHWTMPGTGTLIFFTGRNCRCGFRVLTLSIMIQNDLISTVTRLLTLNLSFFSLLFCLFKRLKQNGYQSLTSVIPIINQSDIFLISHHHCMISTLYNSWPMAILIFYLKEHKQNTAYDEGRRGSLGNSCQS